MGQVLMDSELVSETGNTVVNNSQAFESQVTDFYAGVDAITATDVWSGEADSQEFRKVAEDMRNELASAEQIINEVGVNLTQTANAFDDTVESNKARIASI